MKIAQYITPSRIGGAETHLLGLARMLQERGHEVLVISPRGRPLTIELARRQVPLVAPRTFGKLDPAMILRLARLLKMRDIQVLHTHLSTASLLGALAGRLAGVPVVSTVHGLNHKTCYWLSRRVIAISEAVREHLLKQGLPAERISLIYHGIAARPAVDEAAVASLRAGLEITPGAPVIGTAGRLSVEKGHRFLIEAAPLLGRIPGLAPVRVLIVGDGPERPALEALASSLGVSQSVTFAGFQDDVLPWMALMDVFVLPSVRESLSLASMEAMSLGKPVVASRVGGTPEVIAHGETGLLVEPGSPAALSDAIASLLRDPGLRSRMGEAGRKRVAERFSEEHMVSEIENLYAELVRSHGREARAA